jgi:hypothetical protein
MRRHYYPLGIVDSYNVCFTTQDWKDFFLFVLNSGGNQNNSIGVWGKIC